MSAKHFFSRTDMDKPPMTLSLFSEGAHQPKLMRDIIAFDIETFSPCGFPHDAGDPVVNFSLVVPLVRQGVLSLSVIGEPSLEYGLLYLLRHLLQCFRGAYLLTYNGAKFDLEYVVKRGKKYGLDFNSIFVHLHHVDVYQLLKWLNVRLPRYDQKFVERLLGIRRLVRRISGSSYHIFYRKFLKGGNLEPMFYNIEDSFGCLRIASAISKLLKGKRRK